MSREQKKIVVSSAFNLLSTYSIYFLGLLSTFFIARLITPEEWGILLFSLTFVGVGAYFCYFFPPGAGTTLQYYISRLKNGDKSKINEMRNFIFHVYKIRLVFTISIFIIYLLVIQLFSFNEKIIQTLLITSPLIIIIVFQNLNNSILLGFQKFKIVFYVTIVNMIIYTSGTMLVYLLKLKYPFFLMALLYVAGGLISLITSIIFTFIIIPSKNIITTGKNISEKKNYVEIHKKYGLYLVLSGIIAQINGFIIYYLFISFGVIAFITYFVICSNIVSFIQNMSGSSRSSYLSIFSEINSNEKKNEFTTLFYQTNKYLLLFLGIIVGSMFFLIEFYIILIYSETYLLIVLAVQILLFSSFASVITRNLIIITQSTNRTKINLKIQIFQSGLFLISTLIALVFFDFYILIIFYLISRFLTAIYLVYIINKKSDFNLKQIPIFKPFFLFSISFFLALPITFFINFQIFSEFLMLNFLLNSLLRVLVFFVFYYLIIFFSKYITKEEFKMLIEIFPIVNSQNKLIQKIVYYAEKFFQSEKIKNQ